MLRVLNLPNIITLSRIPFLFVIVGLIFSPWPATDTLAFIFYVLGSISDWLDGFLARRYQMVSNFGKLMDALVDKVFVVGVGIAMLATGLLPQWSVILILIILTREFFVTGLRLVAASQGRVLAAEKAGKIKTVIQMVSMGVLIAAQALKRDFGAWPSLEAVQVFHSLGVMLFAVATALTVYSGWGYVTKYGHLLKE